MKKQKIALLTLLSILTFFGITILIIPQTRAYIGQYEQRTDPSNPFLFTVDIIYVTSDGWIHANEVEYFYHQVFLEANKYYLFYDPVGYMTMEGAKLWIHSAISTSIDYYYEYISEDGVLDYILYINPSQTGLYNITICWGKEGFECHRSFSGIGVLEIPIVPLDTEMSSEYWDFHRDAIMVGIIELDSQVKYQTGYDGRHHDYLGIGTIYYVNINSLSYIGYEKLDGSHDIMDYGAYDEEKEEWITITTNDLGQGAGKYIFYSLEYGWFSLMEAEEEEIKPVSWIPLLLSIIIPIIAIIIVIPIAIFLINKYKRKVPKEDKKSRVQEKKIPKITYCPECGTDILDKSRKFCSVCGTKIIN